MKHIYMALAGAVVIPIGIVLFFVWVLFPIWFTGLFFEGNGHLLASIIAEFMWIGATAGLVESLEKEKVEGV